MSDAEFDDLMGKLLSPNNVKEYSTGESLKDIFFARLVELVKPKGFGQRKK